MIEYDDKLIMKTCCRQRSSWKCTIATVEIGARISKPLLELTKEEMALLLEGLGPTKFIEC
jgi:hypothetical protein